MDEIREVMRLYHCSIHTEQSYCDRINWFILFNKIKSRDGMKEGEGKIEQFLTHTAADGNVSSSTRNQAVNVPVFLYRKVLKQEPEQKIDTVRAKNRETAPLVMTREEVSQVIGFMEGISQLAAKLLHGSGLRITEAIRLRRAVKFSVRFPFSKGNERKIPLPSFTKY
ncbi:MAG: phage integrase N-terminal SAM-like domain-containing protein [Desulfobacterales bacterium]